MTPRVEVYGFEHFISEITYKLNAREG